LSGGIVLGSYDLNSVYQSHVTTYAGASNHYLGVGLGRAGKVGAGVAVAAGAAAAAFAASMILGGVAGIVYPLMAYSQGAVIGVPPLAVSAATGLAVGTGAAPVAAAVAAPILTRAAFKTETGEGLMGEIQAKAGDAASTYLPDIPLQSCLNFYPVDVELSGENLYYPSAWSNHDPKRFPRDKIELSNLIDSQNYEIRLGKFIVRFKKASGTVRVCIKNTDTSIHSYLTSDDFNKNTDFKQIKTALKNLCRDRYTIEGKPNLYEFGYGFTTPERLKLDNNNQVFKKTIESGKLYDVMHDGKTIRFYVYGIYIFLGVKNPDKSYMSQGDFNHWIRKVECNNLYKALRTANKLAVSWLVYNNKCDLLSFGEGFGDDLP